VLSNKIISISLLTNPVCKEKILPFIEASISLITLSLLEEKRLIYLKKGGFKVRQTPMYVGEQKLFSLSQKIITFFALLSSCLPYLQICLCRKHNPFHILTSILKIYCSTISTNFRQLQRKNWHSLCLILILLSYRKRYYTGWIPKLSTLWTCYKT